MYYTVIVQIFQEKNTKKAHISKKYCQIEVYLSDYGCCVVVFFLTYKL